MVLLPDFTVCLQFNQICLSLYVISRAAFAVLPLKTSTRLQVEGGEDMGRARHTMFCFLMEVFSSVFQQFSSLS